MFSSKLKAFLVIRYALLRAPTPIATPRGEPPAQPATPRRPAAAPVGVAQPSRLFSTRPSELLTRKQLGRSKLLGCEEALKVDPKKSLSNWS